MSNFNVLALDGGGSKGVYTLGILKQLENALKQPLHQHFNLIYGTSTGAIIASLLATGKSVSEIEALYFEIIPQIWHQPTRALRSKTIRKHADAIFQQTGFNTCKTDLGIVTTDFEAHRPFVFKSNDAHNQTLLRDAVIASSAAYPLFQRSHIPYNGKTLTVQDGGIVAKNPALLAMADAVVNYQMPRQAIRVLSIGVGHYPSPHYRWYEKLFFLILLFANQRNRLTNNNPAVETLRKMLFADVPYLRIDDRFKSPEYATNLLETDPNKLATTYQAGQSSFAHHKQAILALFNSF